jgi:hypothetical protein
MTNTSLLYGESVWHLVHLTKRPKMVNCSWSWLFIIYIKSVRTAGSDPLSILQFNRSASRKSSFFSIMEAIKKTFAQCKAENRVCIPQWRKQCVSMWASWRHCWLVLWPAFVTFVTAGFPTVEETVDIILGLEAGGAGMQFMMSTQLAYGPNFFFSQISLNSVLSVVSSTIWYPLIF